jgi:hypothetical protein
VSPTAGRWPLFLCVRIGEAGGRLLPEPLNGIPEKIERETRLGNQPHGEPSRRNRRHCVVGGYVRTPARCDHSLHRRSRYISPLEPMERFASNEFVLHGDRKASGRLTLPQNAGWAAIVNLVMCSSQARGRLP